MFLQYSLLNKKERLYPNLDEDTFLLCNSNSKAYTYLQSWPNESINLSNSYAVVLLGAPKTGKTHIAHIWAKKNNAIWIKNDQDITFYQDLYKYNLVFDDIHTIKDEKLLFHALNMVKENNGNILLTSDYNSFYKSFALKDLLSRLDSFDCIILEENRDEEFIKFLLYKYFAEYQIEVKKNIISFILNNIEHKPIEAYNVVYKIGTALEYNSTISLSLVKKILDNT